ncbi:MAG: hypothetical protein IJE28_08525 [Oscillospiraceae bacterium]|nr:hypothetical protein [Oscillospiraceae bacterium]MBQ4643110.1 hypothetical protein [Oscillospiraceae bacterium]
MVFQNEKATVVLDIDEKFVLGCDEEEYDIIFNPENIRSNEPHDAMRIIAKGEKAIRIAIVLRHDKDAVYSGSLYGEKLNVTFGSDAAEINVLTGEILRYEKDAVKEEFDFSELDKLI